jgi:hypothetical protein
MDVRADDAQRELAKFGRRLNETKSRKISNLFYVQRCKICSTFFIILCSVDILIVFSSVFAAILNKPVECSLDCVTFD